MSRHITTRAQVSGHRFGIHRAGHALVRRDVRMMHDPMRTHARSLAAGLVLAVLALAGAGVYGIIRPAPTVGDAAVVVADDGAMYVRIDDVMHPVNGIVSARLLLGEPAEPRHVSDDSLRAFARGPAVGLRGAPTAVGSGVGGSRWTVCDAGGETVVIAGRLRTSGMRSGGGALVEHDGVHWLLYERPGPDGTAVPVRARVDPSDTAVLEALGLRDAPVRTVSAGLINAFPPEPALTVPAIAARGAPGPLGAAVGSVLTTTSVGGRESYHVILDGAVQPVPRPVADAIRLADPTASAQVRRVSPGALATVPVRDDLAVDHFPARTPALVDEHADVLCRSWSRGASDAYATSSLWAGTALPLGDGARPVRMASADGRGPALDGVYLRPGSGEHVRVTGTDPRSPRSATSFYIADTGVRYRIGDGIGEMLGLSATERAPWSVVTLLPSGPELSREAAAVAADTAR
ncbi:type VII secretion protein EccB [Gordonia shandongensis]|uniref:type VII secretion protein EccB n=1 Tax=Gordonia shandongensis TaxID=376351 RepID=UPI0003F5E460|nr:type VII secretion protein EccB [Gordonia shandongensis]